jgi:hypothetical protein
MRYLANVLPLLVFATTVDAQTQGFVSAGRMWVGDDPTGVAVSAGAQRIGRYGLSGGADAVVNFGRTTFRPGFPKGEPYRQYLVSGLVGAHARRAQGWAPFVNGGMSLVTDPDCCGPVFGWNVGGGTNYWLSDGLGIRGDVRLVLPFAGEGRLTMWGIGIAFR